MAAEAGRWRIAELVRLDRYPIDAPGRAAYDGLVARCREQLAASGCAVLPGFLTNGGLRAMRAESAAVAAAAHYSRQRTNVYFTPTTRACRPIIPGACCSTGPAPSCPPMPSRAPR